MVVIDIVTERSGNLHADILAALGPASEEVWAASSGLYAVSYRGVVAEPARLEAWTHELTVGGELPQVPLWLEPDLCVPLRLGESYAVTCGGLRMGG